MTKDLTKAINNCYNVVQTSTGVNRMFKFKDIVQAGAPSMRYVTRGLFKEFNTNSSYTPTFNLKQEDDEDTYSFEKIYLALNDPTEYKLVEQVFNGDVKHWEACKVSPELSDFIDRCREKLMKKLQSEAFGKIMSLAFEDGNKNQMSALKILYDIKPIKTVKEVGRPKKEKKVEEVDNKDLLEDIKRLKE